MDINVANEERTARIVELCDEFVDICHEYTNDKREEDIEDAEILSDILSAIAMIGVYAVSQLPQGRGELLEGFIDLVKFEALRAGLFTSEAGSSVLEESDEEECK
jgi:hypothetical protein